MTIMKKFWVNGPEFFKKTNAWDVAKNCCYFSDGAITKMFRNDSTEKICRIYIKVLISASAENFEFSYKFL